MIAALIVLLLVKQIKRMSSRVAVERLISQFSTCDTIALVVGIRAAKPGAHPILSPTR